MHIKYVLLYCFLVVAPCNAAERNNLQEKKDPYLNILYAQKKMLIEELLNKPNKEAVQELILLEGIIYLVEDKRGTVKNH